MRAADEVRKSAPEPFSNCKVGATEQAGGCIFAAPNVENSSYPLSICAERDAVGMAVAAGQDRIQAIAVMGPGRKSTAPCGGCRQVIWELSDPATTVPVVYATDDRPVVTTTLGDP